MGGPAKYGPETRKKAQEFREKHGLQWQEIGERLGIPETTVKTWGRRERWNAPPVLEVEAHYDPEDPKTREIGRLEIALERTRAELSKTKTIHKSLQRDYERLREDSELSKKIGPPNIEPIVPKQPKGVTEATVIMMASDWHVEEPVDPDTVNGLNEYSTDIAKNRARKFFSSGLRLTNIIRKDVKVGTIILPLLGDFITNDIHDELAETNDLLPMEAVLLAQELLASGITFLLENTDCNLVIPCHSGNHGRTTKKVHHSSEHGHSLEFFMYRNMEKFFASEDRIKFNISTAYHSYQQIYDVNVRFHHGHKINYYGGVGGIYIPVNKAIAQWNKARHADFDMFGHFHQLKDGGNFLSNGSLIGFNPYAIAIKADYEPPRQVFTVIDNKHGRTCTWPIFVESRG